MSNEIEVLANLDHNVLRERMVELNQKLIQQMALAGPEHSGKADKIPWSGWWWPFLETGGPNLYDAGGPLDKYDAYVLARTGTPGVANTWEKGNHITTDPANGWWGHCNGWAAAAVLETEPSQPKIKQNIAFSIGDQKGLVSEAHWYDNADLSVIIGKEAHVFHKILIDWIGKARLPLIMDVSLGAMVNNHPVAAYRMTYSPDAADPQKNHVICTLFGIGYAWSPDNVGTTPLGPATGIDFTYWIKGDKANPSYGEWEGASINDHPDVIWHPVFVASSFHGAFGAGTPAFLIEVLS
jgi:transglutaminase elicitor